MSETLANVTCVAIGGRGVLIEGAPGSGKSSLALALIDRGAVLVGDDGVTVQCDGDAALASPPPNIAGKLEIRNVGLVDLPTCIAPLALVLRLDKAAVRLPDGPVPYDIGGITLPLIPLWPDSPHLALRAEWALRVHGLR